MHMDRAYYERYYAPLAGATIESVEVVEDGQFSDPWPKFTVRLADGSKTELEVSQDEEGNGPGFLFGLPIPRDDNPPEGPHYYVLIDLPNGGGRAVVVAAPDEDAARRIRLDEGETIRAVKTATPRTVRTFYAHDHFIDARFPWQRDEGGS